MPRNMMIVQIDEELVLAKQAMIFWREQTLLADLPLRDCALAVFKQQESHVIRLIEIQEVLAGLKG